MRLIHGIPMKAFVNGDPPRYIRREGVIYRLPRGYRKLLQRAYTSETWGMLFSVTYEMWGDAKYNIFDTGASA